MKIFLILFLFFFLSSAYASDYVTENYSMIVPERADREWLSKISNDIISIDSIMNMMSQDLGTASQKVKISDDATMTIGGQVGRFRFISDDGSVCYIKVFAGE